MIVAAGRREAERFLVGAVEQVRHAADHLDPAPDAPHAPASTTVNPGSRTARRTCRMTARRRASARARRPARTPSARDRAIARSADTWCRGRRSSGWPTTNGGGACADRRPRRASPCRETCSAARVDSPQRVRTRSRELEPRGWAFEMLSVRKMARVLQIRADRDDQVLVAVGEGRGAGHEAPPAKAWSTPASTLRLRSGFRSRVVGEGDLERVGRPDARAGRRVARASSPTGPRRGTGATRNAAESRGLTDVTVSAPNVGRGDRVGVRPRAGRARSARRARRR